MSDYLPLDLSSFCNAPLDLLAGRGTPPSGAVSLRGLPFQVGPADPAASGPRLLAAGAAHAAEPVTLPIGQPAHRVIVLHVLLHSDIADGGPVGQMVAEYRFHLADGTVVAQPVRERFEIAVAGAPWGQLPFVCQPDGQDGKPNREAGPWAGAGNRQTEANQAWPQHFYLWVWQPPDPMQVVESLEVIPHGPAFVIGGVTLGLTDEDPFARDAAVPVIICTTDEVARSGNLDVQVDRGTVTYPFALPAQDPAEFLVDPLSGWGQPQNAAAAPATAQVAATPSATLTVKHGGETLGAVRWGDVTRAGEAADQVVRVRLADTGRNWVHTRVVDADTGETLPCRIHFRTPAGIPYAPHGHHPYAYSNLGSWHNDVGGDLRLGQITYAYIDGTCQGWLPRGEVVVDVARGYEYQPLRTTVTIERGQRELELRLQRTRDLNAERFFSGDTHVHFLSTVGAHLEAAGEGVNVVNLLQSQWGHLFTNTEEFTGEPNVRAGQRTIVYAAQENRQHILGHLTLLGQKQPIMPWCSDGPSESYLGDNLETTLARWADACHAQGGTVVLPHGPNPNGEPAALIATGRADALEFCVHEPYQRREWYRYLNAGYRLPIVGGTDKMTQDVPVGLYRTYVYIPPDEEFTYDAWCRHLRGGNTFVSGGPLLSLTVEGQMPGSTVALPGNGGTVHVRAVATSIFPVRELQLIQQGQVAASVKEPAGARRLELDLELPVTGHTWLAARVADLGDGYTLHHDGWRRGIMAHTSPVYVAVGGDWWLFDAAQAQYMLTLIDGSLQHIRTNSRQFPHDREQVTHAHHHSDHAQWLEEPFHEAAAAIHRRMHALGLAH